MTIRGLREPIDLEHNEALAVQALKSDITKPDTTPFSITGVWSGTKGDIRFVTFPPKTEDAEKFKKIEPMPEKEAEDFKIIVDECRQKAEDEGYPRYYWHYFYLQKVGAVVLERKKSVNPEIGKLLDMKIRNISLYQTGTEKMSRYGLYVSKIEFAEKMNLKALDNLAKEKQI